MHAFAVVDHRLFYGLTAERSDLPGEVPLMLSWYEKRLGGTTWRHRCRPITEAELERAMQSEGPGDIIDLLPALQ